MIDAKAVKDSTRIEEVIGEDEPLKPVRGGRRYEGMHHHSLTVYPEDGYFVWFSRAERGDVFDWLRLRRGMEFADALQLLARRAGMELDWSPDQQQRYQAARRREDAFTSAARYWIRRLCDTPAALAYCQLRGWDKDIIRAAGLGYHDGDTDALRYNLQRDGVDLASDAAQAVLHCPAGMLIYPHIERGRVIYWSARSIEGKRHYNPPRDLVGERLPYFNNIYNASAGQVIIVEGQADAVTLAAWDLPAVALAGCSLGPQLRERLSKHQDLVLGLDDDEEGLGATAQIADALGPLTRIVRWPGHDVNAWSQDSGRADDAQRLVRQAPAWINLVAEGIQAADNRDQALRHLITLASRMDDFQLGTRRADLVKSAGIGLREFNNLLKTVRTEQEQENGADPEKMLVERQAPGGVLATEDGDILFEMMVNGTHSSYAVRWPNGTVSVVRSLEHNNVVYWPYDPAMPLIEKGVVLLPAAIGQYISTQSLVQEIRGFIHAYLDVNPLYERISAYYVLLSWLYDCFTVLPYLRALGDYGTGKSRFLEVVGSICYRPIKTSGASTFSPVFRVIEMFHGSLILDEMDMTMSDTEADFIKLLNSGVARGTPLLRTERVGEQWVVEAYDTFCPKIVATRKRFSDRALESRMLTYEMGAGCRADIPLVLPTVFYEAAQDLRNKLLAYRLQNWRRMEVDYSLADRTVEPRLSQVTLALKAVVDDPTLQREIDEFIREYHRQTVVERGMTLAALILEVIIDQHAEPVATLLDGTHDYDLTLKTIARHTNERMDEENYPDEEEAARRRPRLTPRKVGEEVRKLGLGTQRRADKSRNYEVIWDDERIENLKVRYGLA